MAKPDWGELQQRFLSDNASTGVSPKDWCEAQGLNYATARRYIKKTTAQNVQRNAQKRNAQKKTCNSVISAQTPGRVSGTEEIICAASNPHRSAFCEFLPDREKLFVSYYLESRNKYQAYQKAGYTGSERNARAIYRKPAIARAINKGIEQLSNEALLNAQDILRHWHEIAIADPGEISQMRRVCCRHCWGVDYQYHWIDEAEYDNAVTKASNDGSPLPHQSGGFGFAANDDPNSDCPVCSGEGIEDVYLADTRDLVGPARRLLAGVKKTKFGIEVITRDQDAALKNLAAFYNLASGEQERELRLLEIERVRLSNEKLKAEIENIRKTGGNETVVVHNALKPPGSEKE